MTIREFIFEKTDRYIPYAATFYYAEILYFMVFIHFIYGKLVAVTVSLSLSAALTVHIFRLFHRFDFNRKAQLIIIDIHIAYTVAFITNRFLSGNQLSLFDGVLIAMRAIMALYETAALISLTDSSVIANYNE